LQVVSKSSASFDVPFYSQRQIKSRSWAILLAGIIMSFGISAYGWTKVWARRFCENGYYFDDTESLASRQSAGKGISLRIEFTYDLLFGLQVSFHIISQHEIC
jgi:hypothetical protein